MRWTLSNDLIVWNKRLHNGRCTCIRHGGNSIVDYFISTNELVDPQLTICDDLSLDSDHKMMHLDFQLDIAPQPIEENPRHVWHLGKFNREPHRQNYIDAFQQECNTISTTFMDMDQQPDQQKGSKTVY